jgi:hypothetical protein
MSSFISNIESINSLALQSTRVEDAHTNDAIINLLGTIYSATPNAVIVQMGVEWKNSASLFQAWALHYNPDVLPAYSVDGIGNTLQVLASNLSSDNYIQVGQYQVITNPSNLALGDYFCLFAPEFGDGVPFADSYDYYLYLAGAIPPFSPVINITWEDAGTYYKSSFILAGNDAVDGAVILYFNGGDAIPASGVTGRYGVTKFGA